MTSVTPVQRRSSALISCEVPLHLWLGEEDTHQWCADGHSGLCP